MGLSRKLVRMEPASHIALMPGFLDANPNLYLDIFWTVLGEACVDTPGKRALYAAFFNRYPTRILAGTDFAAARTKTRETCRKEARAAGAILADLDDTAFQAIALGQDYSDIAPGPGASLEAPAVFLH